jgi:hypothetical protein
MKQFRAFAAAALALGVAFATPAAQATPVTFDLAGTFGNAYGGPANNGSFSGTFSVDGLPITPPNTGFSYVYLSSFDITIKNSLGNSLLTFSSANPTNTGYLSAAYESSAGADFLIFYDTSNDWFQLNFAPGFTGTGAIIPLSSGGYLSLADIGGFDPNDTSDVNGGSAGPAAIAAVAEPSSVAVFAATLAAFAGLLGWRRKRSATLAAA